MSDILISNEHANVIDRLMAENARLKAALENIMGVYAHDPACTAEALCKIAASALANG